MKDLVRAIVSGTFSPGTALPPEGMLGERYQVSRTVIREATVALTHKGLVVSEQGRGTIVREPDAWDMLDPLVLVTLFDSDDGLAYLDNLAEIRALLESAMAGKAAVRRTPEKLSALVAQVEKLERLVETPSAYVQEDVVFHDLIMHMSGDRLSKAVIDGLQNEALRTHGYSGKLDVDHVRATQSAHRAVCAAIVEGDADAAARAMRTHIEESWAKRRAKGRVEA